MAALVLFTLILFTDVDFMHVLPAAYVCNFYSFFLNRGGSVCLCVFVCRQDNFFNFLFFAGVGCVTSNRISVVLRVVM